MRDLQFAILRYLGSIGRRNKWNTLGNPGQPGDLELQLGVRFDHEVRARAEYSWESLRREDLIRADYSSISSPNDWVDLTDAGRRALERHALDELDVVLIEASSTLVDMRDRAWRDVDGADWSAWRQAAGAMAELIDILLHALAPDESIRAAPWFKPISDARSGVSRHQRLRSIMERRHGRHEANRCAALVAAHDELEKLKHSRRDRERQTVEGALRFAEEALKQVMIWPTSDENTVNPSIGGEKA